MKLKLTMTNAETGEVLQEETNLDFAMMRFGRKTEEGMDFQGVTRAEQMDPVLFAQCLNGVDRAIEKNCNDNKAVGMAYTFIKMGLMDDSFDVVDLSAQESEENVVSAEGTSKKEGEQG